MKLMTVKRVCTAVALFGIVAMPCIAEESATPGISAEHMPQTAYAHITLDTVKEGSFAQYKRLEAQRVRDLADIKWPYASLALKTMTGLDQQVLYISFFNSFEDLGNETRKLRNNPTVASKLKEIAQKESHLLVRRRVFDIQYQPRISFQGDFNWADQRYLSLIRIHLKPGTGFTYLQNRAIVKKAHEEAKLTERMAIYTVVSGELSGSYLIMRPVTAMKGFDEMFSQLGAPYLAILGPENREKVHELFASSVSTEQEEYYSFDPALSYTTPSWRGSNADFWNKD